MYCNQCGKPMKPHYKGICGSCLYREYIRNASFEEISGKARKSQRARRRKKETKNFIIIFICCVFPVFGIAYLFFKLAIYSGASASAAMVSGSSGNGVSCGGDSTAKSSEQRRFGFVDGHGNLCESGGCFRDWSGYLIEWGQPFHDSRGNLVEWGSPFYDNRGNCVSWGSSFYDAGDNYISP